MLRKILWVGMILALVSVASVAVAQEKDIDLIGTRTGPENFRMAAGPTAECNGVPAGIPDNTPGGVVSSLTTTQNCGAITDLDLSLDISHTWVGDLQVELSNGSVSALVIDRPGYAGSGFGCSGDDIDATLSDGSATSVEDECAAGVPTIQGTFSPSPDALSAFNGEDLCGNWELTVTDNAGGDLGTLFEWCLENTTGGGDDGGDDVVPASNNIGIALMLVLMIGSSAYFIRRRVTN